MNRQNRGASVEFLVPVISQEVRTITIEIEDDLDEKNAQSDLGEFLEEASAFEEEFEKEEALQKNVFPTHIFPEPFRSLITESEASLNFPADYVGTSILLAVSTIVGKGTRLKVKNNWFEYGSLYAGLIGSPGTSKSHAYSIAFEPLLEIDRTRIQQFADALAEYEEVENANNAGNANNAKCKKPILQKSVLDNFTPEVLDLRLSQNEHGTVVLSDELATFLSGMNNYSKSDQSSKYLSFWSNKHTSIDRIKYDLPLVVAVPFLNILGTLQPKVLGKLFPESKTDNGFLQRFIFAFPIDAKKIPINDNEIDENTVTAYRNWMLSYHKNFPIEIVDGKPIPKTLEWAVEAKRFFYKWQKENTERVNELGDCLLAEVYSKFDIIFCRFCLILQVMRSPYTYTISLETAEAAKTLCDYYQQTSARVIGIISSSSPIDILPDNKQALYSLMPETFTTAEGVLISENFGMKERTFKNFIKNKELFRQPKHGLYQKLF